jgi:hypothetical protein
LAISANEAAAVTVRGWIEFVSAAASRHCECAAVGGNRICLVPRLSSSAIGRVELGKIQRVAWGDLEAVAEALDAQLGLDFRWRAGDLDRLLDAAHAAIVESLVRVYRASGWAVVVEATFSEFGERGSIDLLAWHAPTGNVAVNEVKATIADAGRTVMGVDRKGRLAPIVARKLGWTCRGVSRFLVVAEGATARLGSPSTPASSERRSRWGRSRAGPGPKSRPCNPWPG